MFLIIFLSLKQELFITYIICQEYGTYFLLHTWLLAFVLTMKCIHTCSEWILTVNFIIPQRGEGILARLQSVHHVDTIAHGNGSLWRMTLFIWSFAWHPSLSLVHSK